MLRAITLVVSGMFGDPELLGLKVGDLATWIGALASASAAVAAVLAARKAAKIALLPIEQQELSRLFTCRAIAPAVGPEFRRAAEESLTLVEMLGKEPRLLTAQELVQWLQGGILLRTAMIERFLEKFELFGGRDGGLLIAAAGAILNFRGKLAYIANDVSRRQPGSVVFSLEEPAVY
jgi:hypothetical protein